jgi:hypothetical protein
MGAEIGWPEVGRRDGSGQTRNLAMRKLVATLAVMVAFGGGLSMLVQAADDEKVTLEGMAQCAKCALKEKDECQNVVIVKKDGKETKYYLAQNELAKSMHSKAGFCSAKKGAGPKVKVVGTCKEEDKKMVVTAEKIEKVEE